PAPMPPMVDTPAGLAAKPAPPLPTPVAQPAPSMPNVTPGATIGAPIVPPALDAPAAPAAPATAAPAPPAPAGGAVQAAAPAAAPERAVHCNVDACTAAYRSFTAGDCTYQPSNGPRRLCTK